MICLNCNSEDYEVTMSESFQCSHCDGYIFIEYCMCKECSSIWRAIDGVIDEKNVVSPEDLMGMIGDNGPLSGMMTIDADAIDMHDEDFLKRIEEEIMKHDNKSDSATMADLVHKCMKCQAVAYEIKPGFYECVECGFSWEVIDFGDE